jgi:hypothetical protein
MKKSGVIVAIILIIVLSAGTFLIGYLWANDFQFSTKPKLITPIIDGQIEDKEWNRATYYNVPFYLDVDNSIDPLEDLSNVDGWNYISVAEDEDNYYILLDLCSDRTNNLEDEWISYFLANRLPQFMGSRLTLHSLVDLGFEYLFYNVSDDAAFDHQLVPGIFWEDYFYIPFVPELDFMQLDAGTMDGDYLDLWYMHDDNSITLDSQYIDDHPIWLNGSFIDLQFGFNITEKMPHLNESDFMALLVDMEVDFGISASKVVQSTGSHLASADRFYCSVAEHDKMPGDFDDPASYLSDETTLNFPADVYFSGSVGLDVGKINASDGMFYLSFHCWNEQNDTHDASYKLFIDHLSLKLTPWMYLSTIGNTINPGNYDLAWGYGTSPMCSENHRIFEFKIAKSEFPVLDDEKLYICVAGYGTMALEGTNYWKYPPYGVQQNPMYEFLDDLNDFVMFDMSIT